MKKAVVVAVALCGLLIGSLAAGIVLTQAPHAADAALPARQGTICPDGDNEPNETADDHDSVAEDSECDEHEAEPNEGAALQSQATITAEAAKAAAERAYPGTKTLDVELDRLNETSDRVIYEVELDNGIDVNVDASNGTIIGTKARDAE